MTAVTEAMGEGQTSTRLGAFLEMLGGAENE